MPRHESQPDPEFPTLRDILRPTYLISKVGLREKQSISLRQQDLKLG